MRLKKVMLVIANVASGLFGAACGGPTIRFDAKDHCASNEGNEWCRAKDEARPYCGWGESECEGRTRDGCLAAEPSDLACYSPCGGGLRYAEDSSCLGVAEEGTSSSTTSETLDESSESTSTSETESSSTTGPATECDDERPCTFADAAFCNDAGECVSCREAGDLDDACRELGLGIDVCNDVGVCVQCTPENTSACEGTTPLCGTDTSACEPCRAHADCGEGDEAACHLLAGHPLAGSCFSAEPDAVHHVGTEQEFARIADALAAIEDEGQAVIVLHNGTPNFDEAATLTGNRIVAFKRAEGSTAQWIQSGQANQPTLALEDGAIAYFDGLRLSLNGQATAPALRVTSATAYLQRTEVVNNNGLGISVTGENATLIAEQTQVTGNDGGGIAASAGANVRLENSFVSGPVNISAITSTGATLDILYSTVGNSTFNTVAALTCDGASIVTVRSSVIATQGGSVDALACAGAIVTTSLIADSSTVPPFAPGWFEGYDNGDFHLREGHPFADVAVWLEGDPTVDIDGDPRPFGKDNQDMAGADVPTP